jgi:hypothetical protein
MSRQIPLRCCWSDELRTAAGISWRSQVRAELPGWLTAVERVYRTRVVDAERAEPDSARTDACVDVHVDAADTARTRLNTAAVDCVLALTLTLAGGPAGAAAPTDVEAAEEVGTATVGERLLPHLGTLTHLVAVLRRWQRGRALAACALEQIGCRLQGVGQHCDLSPYPRTGPDPVAAANAPHMTGGERPIPTVVERTTVGGEGSGEGGTNNQQLRSVCVS